jgi:hypothetical protein
VQRLFHTTLTTWTTTENVYDRHQWAMRPLLIGAFQVYVALAATVGMRFRYRILVHFLLLAYWLLNTAPMTGMFCYNVFCQSYRSSACLSELPQKRPLILFDRNLWRKPRSRHSPRGAFSPPPNAKLPGVTSTTALVHRCTRHPRCRAFSGRLPART